MDSWRRMAADLPDHHVLAVEMFRVDRNTTVSIFTLVRHGKVVQEVLQGDGRGLSVKPVAPRTQPRGEPCPPIPLGRQFHIDALMAPAALAPAAGQTGDGGITPASIAYGEPPPQDNPRPGVIAVGGTGLQNAFDTGEIVTAE
jgi:hypothetical protein